ncbi:MAG: tail fiber domain-containing protein [Bacteriovorax sp.]|nr:tail fiber domain-containing protein [Bacteriovorax sp.]
MKQNTSSAMSVANVQLINNQVVITGKNLNDVSTFNIVNGGTTTNLVIESQSATSIVANTLSNVTFAAGVVFDFVLSTASATSTFQVTFTTANNSITAPMLTSMGATTGQIMKYNGATWVPSTITNAQTYLGTWSAAGNSPNITSPSSTPGDYYIVSSAGTLSGITYAIGDWIISDGYNWQKVANSAVVVSTFNGRRGTVTLVPGDYASLKSGGKITGSSINDLADVNISGTPADNDVLKYDLTNNKWIAGAAAGGGGSVTGVTATAPLSVSGTTAPIVSIATAASGVAGALSNTDFDTFNNKLGKTLTAGQIFVGSNGTNIATGVAVSGDVTINDTGVTAVGAGKITNAMLAGSIDLASKITGALPIANGGTAGVTASAARANLGLVIGTGLGELMAFTTAMSCFPYEKLQVSAAPYYLTCVTDNGNTNYALLVGRASGQILKGGTAASENLTLDSTAHATKGYVLINPTGGNVGIGTTNPIYNLHIKAQTGNNVSQILANSDFVFGSAATAIEIFSGAPSGNTFGAIQVNNSGGTVNGKLALNPWGGNVGIGTTVPLSKLDVNGSLAVGTYAEVSAAPANGMIVSGNVGIGVAIPTEKLEVSGNIKVTEIIYSSDRNLKKNIKPLQNSLEKLLGLQGVQYQWRYEDYPERNFDQNQHIGLIAQEVAKFFPDLVHGQEGNLAVNYIGLIAPIIESIKTQNTKIKSLESEIAELKMTNAKEHALLLQLMNRMNKLEKK